MRDIAGPMATQGGSALLNGAPPQPPAQTAGRAMFTAPEGDDEQAAIAGNPVLATMAAMQAIDKDVQKLIAANPGDTQLAEQLAPMLQGIREVVVQFLSAKQAPNAGAAQMPGLPPQLPPGTGIGQGQQLGTGL